MRPRSGRSHKAGSSSTTRSRCAFLALFLGAAASATGPVRAEAPGESAEGRLPTGAAWLADRPAHWNGTLLLWSRGYSPGVPTAEDAPPMVKTWLLDHGYALAGSNYGAAGWALAEAVPSQIETIDAFTRRFGRPRRVIAWGYSMGGLVTTALVERRPDRIDAALPFCGSMSGAVGMMNTALEGAAAFKILLDPEGTVQLVGIADDRVNLASVTAAVSRAQATPEGRARLALAAALAELPPWTDPAAPEPAATDYEAQEAQAAKAFPMGVFLPRADQERRAGGVYSWTTGADARSHLERSGRRAFVEALYGEAGLNLDSDLERLDNQARIVADPHAVAYMAANYAPSGRLSRPVLTVHTTGDGMTVPANESAYAEAVRGAGASAWLAQAWVRRAGHCSFNAAEVLASLKTLEGRLDTGRWSTDPKEMQSAASAIDLGSADFVQYTPPAFTRPCSGSPLRCEQDR